MLWMTNHLEPFYITEGPMVAKLWRLEKMTSDGMLLERASKHADPSWQKLVVRPNEAAIVIMNHHFDYFKKGLSSSKRRQPPFLDKWLT